MGSRASGASSGDGKPRAPGPRIRALCASIAGSALVFAGCGAAAGEAEVRDLRNRLQTSERAREEVSERMAELENRVFLLSDRVESQKVELGRRGGAPRLPVFKLQPESAEPVAASGAADDLGMRRPVTLRAPDPPREDPFDDRGSLPNTIAAEEPPPSFADPPAVRPPHPRKLYEDGSPPSSGAVAARSAPNKRRSVRLEGNGAPTLGSSENLGVVKLPDHGVPLTHDHDPGPAGSAVETLASGGGSGCPAPNAAYKHAYDALFARKYSDAEQEFREFVNRCPRHELADNAQYWLGETKYARKDYAGAAPEFQAVVARWPSGNKAPDALLKLGFCLLSLGEKDKARDVLQQVVEHYPNTEAAAKAKARLEELPKAEAPLGPRL